IVNRWEKGKKGFFLTTLAEASNWIEGDVTPFLHLEFPWPHAQPPEHDAMRDWWDLLVGEQIEAVEKNLRNRIRHYEALQKQARKILGHDRDLPLCQIPTPVLASGQEDSTECGAAEAENFWRSG
ncbi:MAG: hypothetical protein EBU84_21465, partial [Actinobacteria bacterium]|nr:hypothetical protein [Actinomycetota bacterium]